MERAWADCIQQEDRLLLTACFIPLAEMNLMIPSGDVEQQLVGKRKQHMGDYRRWISTNTVFPNCPNF
jgi:hypothetical protein